jgi:hypothetical protein
MSAKATKQRGAAILQITLDYIFVYAIEPPHQPNRWMRIVAQDTGSVMFGDWQGATSAFSPQTEIEIDQSGIDCTWTADGYSVPDYPSVPGEASPEPSVTPSGTPVNPYAMTGPNVPAGCHETTGT